MHFLGLFRFALLYREARVDVQKPAGIWGAYVMGLAFGFGWTPCIGPILAAILAVAASEETIGRGIGLLAAYSAGLGLPFLLVALAIEPFIRAIKRFRPYFGAIERVVGVLLVATGIAFLTGSIQDFSAWLLQSFPGLANLGIAAGRLFAEFMVAEASIGSFPPDIDHITGVDDIALCVVADAANDGLESHAGVHGLCHGRGIGRLRRLGRLFDDFNGGIGIERVGFGIEILRLEFPHHLGGFRPVARIGWKGHERAFDGGTSDRGEFIGCNAVARHHHGIHALIAHLADEQSGLGVDTAPDRQCQLPMP